MRTSQLVRQNLKYYWRTNLAVVFGVATAVAILAGALLVGDSVRASLRDLFLQRLGQTDHVITAAGFFREQLAEELRPQLNARGFFENCPLIELEGNASRDDGGRAGSVRVYGVDKRFFQFHGRYEQSAPENREVLVSESLARELSGRPGDALIIRIEKPSDVPIESLYGKKDDLGRTLRLTIREILSSTKLGEFSTRPQQSGVRAVFVPLQLLQQELEQQNRVNTILVSRLNTAGDSETERTQALAGLLKDSAHLEDYNVKLRLLDPQNLSLETRAGMISETLAKQVDEALQETGTLPLMSYLVNSMRLENGRAIPYSIATGIPDGLFDTLLNDRLGNRRCVRYPGGLPPLVLNDWAADDLGAKSGDRITLDYHVWLDQGQLVSRSSEFRVACVIPMGGIAADRNLVPDYPGITEAENVSDWDPPFPMDLNQIRPQDEAYWQKHRTAPKAFLPLGFAQQLWQSRFGKLTSLRINPGPGRFNEQIVKDRLRTTLDPGQMGFAILPVRAQGLEASRGATDFDEYFLYFSFFLVISALLLASLFFKLGIEQRLREIGTLQAIGFSAAKIRRLFLSEAFVLAVSGGLVGLIGAVAYGYLILLGLRTWWVDAVGTTLLRLHVSPLSLALGAAGGIVAVVITIVWTLRRLGKASTRSLLSGAPASFKPSRSRVFVSRRLHTAALAAMILTILGIVLLIAAYFQLIPEVAGFFGGGASLLVALLCFQSAWLRRRQKKAIQGTGWLTVSRLGFRNVTHRPARSVLCITLIAFSTFIIVAVDAFRRNGAELKDKKSGSGGFPLMAESLVPLVHDLNTPAGREALNLGNDATSPSIANDATFTRFRLRPGDDASCLNLYAPSNPRILGANENLIRSNRFAFQSAQSQNSEESENPWLLLNRELGEGVVPVIADANSISYVLHLKVGDEFVLTRNEGPVRLRIVAALSDSIFQSELVMSEKNFVRLFPDQEGYRFFLIDAPERELPTVAAILEDRLADFGFDVVSTNERLANFHRVENTYLSTFQMLGGLGLVLGTLGMAAVLLRNVFERRRELALLRAVGYASSHFALMVIAENALLLTLGLLTGAVCALLAIAPVFFERGGRLPNVSLGFLLLAVLISGLTASLVATWAALRSPLLPALRAE